MHMWDKDWVWGSVVAMEAGGVQRLGLTTGAISIASVLRNPLVALVAFVLVEFFCNISRSMQLSWLD
jgi:hypothetical protein